MERTYQISVTRPAAAYAKGTDAEQLLTDADVGLYTKKADADSPENPVAIPALLIEPCSSEYCLKSRFATQGFSSQVRLEDPTEI